MKIEHIAIWVSDLEKMRQFYETYFAAVSGNKYVNPKKKFSSYFMTLQDGPRIEIMHRPDILVGSQSTGAGHGLAHFAVSLGSKKQVDDMTELMRSDGHKIIGEPRTTGDGYYESVVADPEGNLIELTI